MGMSPINTGDFVADIHFFSLFITLNKLLKYDKRHISSGVLGCQ